MSSRFFGACLFAYPFNHAPVVPIDVTEAIAAAASSSLSTTTAAPFRRPGTARPESTPIGARGRMCTISIPSAEGGLAALRGNAPALSAARRASKVHPRNRGREGMVGLERRQEPLANGGRREEASRRRKTGRDDLVVLLLAFENGVPNHQASCVIDGLTAMASALRRPPRPR